MHLDTMSIADAVAIMNQQDAIAIAAVAAESVNVAKAIDLVVSAFNAGGRLFYFGAGTSGRLGVLDASECPPTFGSDPQQVQGIIAGGESAMFRAKEGAEDSTEGGAAAVEEMNVDARDVVVGIAAGGTTPFVHGALRQARSRGARTIFLSCVQPVPNEPVVDVVIRPLTGPEVLTGSTRLKAGTATKLILNQITTIAMVQMGKCYENLMVDLRAGNQKLRDRALRIVMMLTGLEPPAAAGLLQQADGDVKIAVVMHRRGISRDLAKQLLQQHGGQLRAALQHAPPTAIA
jgi:N-acetylmuramic acid 6-phosphate etherase